LRQTIVTCLPIARIDEFAVLTAQSVVGLLFRPVSQTDRDPALARAQCAVTGSRPLRGKRLIPWICCRSRNDRLGDKGNTPAGE
jgi:hypothetical protein